MQETRIELYNTQAEQIILGTIILNNEYLSKVSEIIVAENFYEPAHQKIFLQITHNIEKNNIIANQVTLKQFFDNESSIKSIGGSSYLSILVGCASLIVDIAQYARIVKDFALKRQLAMIAEDIARDVYSLDEKNNNAKSHIERAETSLFNLTNTDISRNDFKNISSSLKITLDKTIIARKRESAISGISTGLADLDKMLGGMQNSDLIILAGRPSMGKTALAINIAVNACKFINRDMDDDSEKKAVGFFSLEMSSDQLAARILSMEASINATKFRSGQISDIEWEAIASRSGEISKWPFYIDDTPALSISAIRTRTRRLIRKNNLALVIVDYLQLVKALDSKNLENRTQEISEITQGLKAIAKEFNIPVLALSQLSRAVEQREDKRPQLSDLRESGSIEQDADIVAFIYRESYYLERKQPPESDIQKFEQWKNEMNKLRNISEVIIAKQRNGPVGNLHLFFDAEFTRFGNLDTYHNF